MGIQSFVPAGGGGTPGFDYIASINMTTYNRSWAQSGAAGNYVLSSYNKNSGQAYFVGSGVTTGIPLGYVAVVNHAFTSINIVAPAADYISLFKASVKSTTVFNNALDGFASFPSTITSSGNFILPNNALPLINVLLCGGGGGAHNHSGGGGGGGVVKLTAYQSVGTTSITIGAGGYHNPGGQGGATYYGNVYAMGGATSPDTNSSTHSATAANGGGYSTNSGHSGTTLGFAGVAQTATTGLGTVGSPQFIGGYRGGGITGSFTPNHGGGGGAGAGGDGLQRTSTGSGTGQGGPGHLSNISGSDHYYGTGGGGAHHASPQVTGTSSTARGYGSGANAHYSNNTYGDAGAVVVRYYIP